MALEWNLTKIQDMENVCFRHTDDGERDGIKPETEAIIWYTVITGVGWGLTEDNVEEFWSRVAFHQQLFPPMVIGPKEGSDDEFERKPLDRDTVLAHVGLYTNVSMEPRSEWLARMFHQFATADAKAKIPKRQGGLPAIEYDSSREYNKWTVFDGQGHIERRCYSQEEAEEVLAELRDQAKAEEMQDEYSNRD